MNTVKSYIIGFISSIVLTLTAYLLVYFHVRSAHEWISHPTLFAIIIGLALIQLIVQLIFFLHIGKGADKYWNVAALISTVSIILILVIGSLWIMNHLNYNMTPGEMNTYMLKQENIPTVPK